MSTEVAGSSKRKRDAVDEEISTEQSSGATQLVNKVTDIESKVESFTSETHKQSEEKSAKPLSAKRLKGEGENAFAQSKEQDAISPPVKRGNPQNMVDTPNRSVNLAFSEKLKKEGADCSFNESKVENVVSPFVKQSKEQVVKARFSKDFVGASLGPSSSKRSHEESLKTSTSNESKEESSNVPSLKRIRDESNVNVSSSSPKQCKEEREVASPAKESDSDSDCISQEDLLAQLGLNSVKKLQTVEVDPNRVIHPEPPKQSILELLKHPNYRKVLPSSATPCKEKPLVNGSFGEAPEDAENIESKEKLILRLQNNLRNEEAKLMLLRKLYGCQNDKVSKEVAPARSGTATVGTTTGQTQTNTTATQRKTTLPPGNPKQIHLQQKPHKQLVRLQQKTPQKSPVLVQKPPQANAPGSQPRVVFLSQPRGPQPVIIAPKLVPASDGKHDKPRQMKVHMVSSNTSKPAAKSHQSVPASVGHPSKRSAQPVHVVNDKPRPTENGLSKPVLNKIRTSPEQSHAEAKMALRKQLERTLLEIPLPKPPLQDWSFVPSVNTQDFTILVGLEGVVNHIVESQDSTSVKPKRFVAPKFCAMCDTDFTPGWKVKSNEDTLCESCYTQQIKKTLKTEHTTRLKDAFMKALKQEQEVEKKFQLSGASVSTVSIGKTAAVKPQVVRTSSAHQPIHPSPARIVYHPVHTIQPQVYQPHHSIVHQLQQQQIQQQELDNRQEPRYFTYVGQPQPKQRHNYTSENERQREYLLDMIPSGHSSRGYRI